MVYRIVILLIFVFNFVNANDDIKKLKSFQGEFKQTIKSISDKKIEYKGKVFIKNNGKILWKYKLPIEKNVFINNDFVIVDEPELEQAIYTKLQNEINIIKLLNSSEKINNDTYMTKIEDIDYLIGIKNSKINSIKYKDKLDNKVIIEFLNVSQNKNIDDKIFKFVAPDDYDIIRK